MKSSEQINAERARRVELLDKIIRLYMGAKKMTYLEAATFVREQRPKVWAKVYGGG